MDELTYYLRTGFQEAIELAQWWAAQPCDEERPYDNKYKAIKILKEVRPTQYSFIVEAQLGELYNDVDQLSDSVRAYQASLELFSKLDKDFPLERYYNVLITVYNMLGLTYLNRDLNEEGVSLLGKATVVYEAHQDVKQQSCYHNRTHAANGRFSYYYEGGFDEKELESSYTLTHFYLAQAYTKLGFKDKAAEFCGRTLQRQFKTKTFELGEFIRNLISLAEYYQGNQMFAQAEYLLLLGLKLLPEGGKKKSHANLYISLGNMLRDLLDFCCRHIRSQQPFEPNADDIISRKIFQFEGVDLKFPRVSVAKDLQACKSVFRQANTQYKKALQTYVLDGFVTEHVDILFSQSKLYKSLCLIDQSMERVAGMLQRRRDLMLPLHKQLNPKAYQNTWERVLMELASICNELFETKFKILFESSREKIPSLNKVKAMNDCGFQSISFYCDIERTLMESTDIDKNVEYYQSMINSKFNQAKAYSRLYSHDNKERVEFLKKALQSYTALRDYITSLKKQEKFQNEFQKEQQMSIEMVAMLPSKIDRVNYGLMNGIMQ